ncbi:MAG: 6-carboxytetrahydropterin synthase [Sphingobacteriia bacterium]|nr:6-carboxytetrahydropterin synthase [Sphingobacteriia bacterium]
MLQVTKIFRFETAHAIHGYNGHCKNIHGHSYVLHVTVGSEIGNVEFLPKPGFVIDFKDLKKLVHSIIVNQFDHHLILSEDFLAEHPNTGNPENLIVWKMEPTAENILLYIRNILLKELPPQILLRKLKIYETSDSYAEWENTGIK